MDVEKQSPVASSKSLIPTTSLAEWVRERAQNCHKIAATKQGMERAGWLEDADYFEQIILMLRAEDGRLGSRPSYRHALTTLRLRAHLLREALRQMVEWHGGAHDKDCPEDDTCNCSGKPLNDLINAVLRDSDPITIANRLRSPWT